MLDCRYWIWLSLKFDAGSVTCDALLQSFNQNPKLIYEADRDTLEPFCKNKSILLNLLLDKSLENVYKILEFCEKENIGILTQDSPQYPSSLLRIVGKPIVLYYKGIIPDFSKKLTVGVVGTRNVTPYGSTSAYTVSHDLASAGAIVVSGMALGTDTAAHRAAIDAKGCTVAFLGCGIDRVYPRENTRLMQEIIENGAVMTDYIPGSKPEGWHFPVRNRLISGVSHGVLVVEASAKSGALITASHALKQGKLLYAIPGKVGELASVGTNQLICDGAKTVTSSNDILSDFSGLFDLKVPAKIKSNFSVKAKAIGTSADFSKKYKTPKYNAKSPESMRETKYSESPKPISEETNEIHIPKEYGPPQNTGDGYDKEIVFINRPHNKDVLEHPKPIILYNGFDGEMEEQESAKAYASMSKDETMDSDELQDLGLSRNYIMYPKGPIPEKGYKVELTEEKIRYFDEINERNNRAPGTKQEFVISSPVKTVHTLKELCKMHEMEEKEHQRREKLRKELKEKGQPDYIGMSEAEIKVYEYINKHGKIGVDNMGCLGYSLPNLLSVLTLLEIKHKVIQRPGGFFEIRDDD